MVRRTGSPAEVLDEASATSLFLAPGADCSYQHRGAVSHGKLPDFGIGDVQLQMHEVPLSTLVQLAVLCHLGQEGVLGIKRPGREDKHPLLPSSVLAASRHVPSAPRAGSQHVSTGLSWFVFQSAPQN